MFGLLLAVIWVAKAAQALDCLVIIDKAKIFQTASAGGFAQLLREGLFSEQKQGPYLSRGLWVELASGKKVFSASDFLGSDHALMLADVERMHGGDAVKKVLWVGELGYEKIGNDFVIASANHTSGMWWAAKSGDKPLPLQTQPAELSNDALAMANALRVAGVPIKDADAFQVIPYADDNRHLIPVKVKLGESLLHEYQNKVNYITMALHGLKPGATEAYVREAADDTAKVIREQGLPLIQQMKVIFSDRGPDSFRRDLEINLETYQDLLTIDDTPQSPTAAQKAAFDAAVARLTAPGRSAQAMRAVDRLSKAVQSIQIATSGNYGEPAAGGLSAPATLPKVVHLNFAP